MGKLIVLPLNASGSAGSVPPSHEMPSTTEARRASGLRLRSALREHGCSNEWLGRFAGVSRQAVQRWCAGEVTVPEARLDLAAERNPRCRRVVDSYRAATSAKEAA